MIWGVAAVMLIAPKENQIAGNIPATTLAKASSDIPVVKINLNGIQPVKLAFNAPRAVERAKISITLPDNVFLKGFPGEKNIVWETDLAAGDNTLSLPIVGKQIRDDLVQDFLIAKVSHKGGEQSLSLRLRVVNPGMSHYSSHARSSA
jgi:hypothetical protein